MIIIQNYNNFDKLVAALKFKNQQKSCYFIVKNDFGTEDHMVYRGAMLTFSNIATDEDNYIYLNIIYKTKALDSKITIDNEDEGLIKLTYNDLASLLMANKLEAFYSDMNKKDTEIAKLINKEVR